MKIPLPLFIKRFHVLHVEWIPLMLAGFTFLIVPSILMEANADQGIMKIDCGPKPISIEFYERVSYFSLAASFGLVFLLTFFNSKPLKFFLGVLALTALGIWGYVFLTADYEETRRIIFNYNIKAEQALNNLAEGQDRYKSEYGVYMNDLKELHSHVAGASGVDRCVNIYDIKVYHEYWTATAQQVSSPDKIYWDSRKGSSLKKG
tara:strand:- start:2948 stop:3562 length:615 start_codon:yes stop_codon:yes gene_type:complete